MATRSFHVVMTSRPCSLTADAARASFDFLIEMTLVVTKTGQNKARPGRVPTLRTRISPIR